MTMGIADWQYHYRGLTFGNGTDYPVKAVSGLDGYEARFEDLPIPRGDGSLPGRSYVPSRLPEFTFLIIGDGNGLIEYRWKQLLATFSPTGGVEFPLTWKRPHQPERQILCSPISVSRTDEAPRGLIVAEPRFGLRATDPRIYSTEQRRVRVPVFAAGTGGADYPGDYPKDTPVTGLEAIAVNEGSASAWPIIHVWGPSSGIMTGFTLTNATTGEDFTVELEMQPGTLLRADMHARITGNGDPVVTLDGSTRYGAWQQPRTPWRIGPGDNRLRLTVQGNATGVECLITYYDTSLG